MTNAKIIAKLEEILEILEDSDDTNGETRSALHTLIRELETPDINTYGDDDWAMPSGAEEKYYE